ncbi:MAG: PIG-L family deacetylase [Acidobacteria bacterium]|nr:PIG-L family deacetylase [Acidobacteriota bacterium]
MFRSLVIFAFTAVAIAQHRRILVVTASSGDYIFGAGGTLAKFARDGWRVDVAQVGNDEKRFAGVQAEARLAATAEGRRAATAIGVTDIVRLDHKSGELGYVSATELRNQLFALIRGIKPRILFIPDPYVHYQDDHDRIRTGLAAETAWGYSGGGTFANELTRFGFAPYGVPEIYYYTPGRPYRAGEGGEVVKAKFVSLDITGAPMEAKLVAVGAEGRQFTTDLARAIGAKHGVTHAEEFNHVGPSTEEIPPYALQRARPRTTK